MINIICTSHTVRVKYVLDFVFNDVLGCEYTLHTKKPLITNGPILFYSSETASQADFTINKCSILEESHIRNVLGEVEVLTNEVLDVFGKTNVTHKIPDIFSFIFFCISRYEEYLPSEKDQLGRFQAKNSIFFKENLIERALVDESIQWLKLLIENRYQEYRFPKTINSDAISTIDIDQVWSYAHKGWRNFPGLIKDFLYLDFKNIKRRLSSWKDTTNDPFNTYDIIEELHADLNIKSRYFILLSAKNTSIDKNHKPTNPYFVQKLKDLSKEHELGIHPSFHSHISLKFLRSEKKKLEKIIGKVVSDSRQHFLMFRFPETYRDLIKIGIKRDFSMGYAETLGYRASTGHQFRWFDLEKNEVKDLTIVPFQIMDVSLKNYMKLNADEAINKIEKLKNYSKKIESPICVIWHNSSLDEGGDWKGWTEVYRKCISEN